jgi:hypothetical protein
MLRYLHNYLFQHSKKGRYICDQLQFEEKGIISGKKNETYDIRVKTIRDSFYHYFLITPLKMLKEI